MRYCSNVIRSLPAAFSLALLVPGTGGTGVAWADAPNNETSCAPPAAPASPTDTLLVEGGSLAEPIFDKLLVDNGAMLKQVGLPQGGVFDNVNIDQARCDLAAGAADLGVVEFPLTGAETAAAKSVGRTYAYVPLAAVPIAVAAIVVVNPSDQTFQPGHTDCPNLQLSVPLLADVFTKGGGTTYWNDSKLNTISGGTSPCAVSNQSAIITPEFIQDPAASTYALSNLFLNDPDASKTWASFLQTYHSTAAGPVETWPTNQGLNGGDQGLVTKLVGLNDQSQVAAPSGWGQGDVAPVPSDWLQVPIGASPSSQVTIPTIAVQNAAGSYVKPTTGSAAAALSDASFDTSNLVTFKPSTTDNGAYPIMVMSYLAVPTSGLSAAKASAVSNLISFAYSQQGQSEIKAFNAAPPTADMMQYGQSVAAELEAAMGSSGSFGSNGSSGSSSGSTATTVLANTGVGPAAASDTASLAFTGGAVLPLLAGGSSLVIAATAYRRRLRRRTFTPGAR